MKDIRQQLSSNQWLIAPVFLPLEKTDYEVSYLCNKTYDFFLLLKKTELKFKKKKKYMLCIEVEVKAKGKDVQSHCKFSSFLDFGAGVTARLQ